jgi:hypothetical protein
MLLLCNMSQIATGVPYSESPRNKSQSGPIHINIQRNLTCFRPVQSCDLLGCGSMSLGYSQKLLKKVGVHVLGVLSKITQTSGGPALVLLISLSSRAHLTPIPLSSHVRHVTQVRWCKISSINRSTSCTFWGFSIIPPSHGSSTSGPSGTSSTSSTSSTSNTNNASSTNPTNTPSVGDDCCLA